MPEHNTGHMGGTMRLGQRPTLFKTDNSVLSKCNCNHLTKFFDTIKWLQVCSEQAFEKRALNILREPTYLLRCTGNFKTSQLAKNRKLNLQFKNDFWENKCLSATKLIKEKNEGSILDFRELC